MRSSPDSLGPRNGLTRRDLLIASAAALGGGATTEALRNLMNREKRFYDRRDVEAHLAHSLIEWEPAGHVLNTRKLACMDGREDQCNCCVPGGNMGEAVEEFTAVEQITGRRCTDEEIDAAFGRRLELNPAPFYLHTDSHAVHRIAHMLHVTVAEAEELIRQPGDREEGVLRALLSAPGCGHMAGFSQRPDRYPGIRPQVPRALMRAFYKRLWSPDPRVSGRMYHRIVPGNHREKAVLLLEGNGDETSPTPLVQPQKQDSSLFVVDLHMMDLANRRFARIAREVMRLPKGALDEARLLAALQDLGHRHLEASRQALAPEHPVFRGHIDERRRKISVTA